MLVEQADECIINKLNEELTIRLTCHNADYTADVCFAAGLYRKTGKY